MTRARWMAPLVLPLALAGVALAHSWMPIPKKVELGEPFVPRPEVARLCSFGFQTVMSDFYWLSAVQVVGASLRPEAEGTLLGRYIDVVTRVDPWVDHPYRFAAVWLTGSEADVRQADRLLLRSFPYHPEEWRNRFYLGFNLFYYLGQDLEASHWIERAAKLPGSPAYLGGLAARLRAGSDGLEVAADMIQEMWRRSEDPYRRATYEKMLDEIETERRARRLDAARERYRRRTGHDIGSPEDLVRGPRPVLERLPREPHGWEWVLQPDTGEIVSSYYNSRYRPHRPDARSRKFIHGWAVEEGRSTPDRGKEAALR